MAISAHSLEGGRMPAVLTVDQRGSRVRTDAVPGLLARFTEPHAPVLLRGFQRTAGDEVQAVADDPEAVVLTLATILRDRGWSIGLGVGPVDEPLPADTRAGHGPAFVLAREAVTRAKAVPHHLGVVG